MIDIVTRRKWWKFLSNTFEATWERRHIYGRRFSPTEKLLSAWREAATKNTSAFPGYFWRGSFKAPKYLIGQLNLVTELDYGRIYLTEHV